MEKSDLDDFEEVEKKTKNQVVAEFDEQARLYDYWFNLINETFGQPPETVVVTKKKEKKK